MTQIDASKVSAYAVLSSKQEEVSKSVVYAVLSSSRIFDSKFSGYAVLSEPVGDRVAKYSAYAVLFNETPPGVTVRASMVTIEAFTADEANVRSPSMLAEAFTSYAPNVRLSFGVAEAITGGNPTVRCPAIVAEVFFLVPEEPTVVDPVFPVAAVPDSPFVNAGLRGLGWSVHKKPMFSTEIAGHSSGQEIRAAFWENPKWDFDLTFEYLPDKPEEGKNDLRVLMDFFLSRQGSFDAFAFRDPTDYEVEGQAIATADGVTLQFPIVRTLVDGGFAETVGQVDFSDLATFASTAITVGTDEITIPSHGFTTGFGPVVVTTDGSLPAGISADQRLWVIRVDDNTIQLATSKANAEAGMAVDLTTQGSGTDTIESSIQVYDDGTPVDPADYTVTGNQLIFDAAPTDMHDITADFKFFFVVRFNEDMVDFENFAYKLWELQTCTFRSLIQ